MTKYSIPDVEDLLHSIEKNTSFLSWLNPINLEEEKQKFFERKYKYNPIFKYDKPDYSKEYSTLLDIEIESNEEIKVLYEKKIEFMIKRFELLQYLNKDDEKVFEISKFLFGESHGKYLDRAKKVIKENKELNKSSIERLGKDEIVGIIESNLDQLSVNYNIEIIKSDFNRVIVDHFNEIIKIPDRIKKDKDSIISTVNHEINTHIQRAENGKRQKYKIFYLGTANYLPTEEGLAILMGHKDLDNKLMYKGASMNVGLESAKENDFIGIFNSMYELERKPKTIFNRTLRIKRGINNTDSNYYLTKDNYFEWAIDLGRELLDNPDNLNYVFNGKGTINELKKYGNKENFYSNQLNISNISNILNINFNPNE